MTALAVVWNLDDRGPPSVEIEAALRGQGCFTPDAVAIKVVGQIGFGRASRPTLPEDAFDNQPFVGPEGAHALIADARVDNRGELCAALGITHAGRESDSSLILRAYQRWGERFVDHLIGDFAVVAWSQTEQRLRLFRDPTGQRPLHFARSSRGIAIASSPQGLLALGSVGSALNFRHLAEFVADVPRHGQETYFEAICRVEPGHVVTLGRDHINSRPYWAFHARTLQLATSADYVEAFRERLDSAVRARLRGPGTAVGAHLSSGIDSGAVTTTAARLLGNNGIVVAFTSAPREGFSGAVPRGRAGDESGPASSIAAAYPNVRHLILRSGGGSPLDVLKRDAILYGEPLGLPCNQVWWSAVHQQARQLGLGVILTGESGNLTISAGGLSVLARYLATRSLAEWARQVAQLHQSGFSLRGLLASSFAPWLPRSVWRSLTQYANGPSVSQEGISLLQPQYRAHIRSLQKFARGERPEPNEAIQRWRMLQAQDPGNFRHGVLEHWGVDERDVASDRRLAEFCLSLPPELLLAEGETRRMARLALADRIPNAPWPWQRGYQGADWFEQINRTTLLAEWNELRDSPAVQEFLDRATVERVIRSWPETGFETGAVISKYRLMLLRVLSAARFADAAGRTDWNPPRAGLSHKSEPSKRSADSK